MSKSIERNMIDSLEDTLRKTEEYAGNEGADYLIEDASTISFTPTGSISSTNVQDAIEEIAADVGDDEDALADHLTDAVDAHDASAISFVPTGSISATNVQDALAEIVAEEGDPSSDTMVWMPLTTVVGGEPQLVWDGDDGLIPTLVDV